MTVFKANNSTQSPWEAFYFRALYKNEAFPKAPTTPELRDFSFAEDVMYGRVDTKLNTIYPNEDNMKIIVSEDNTESSYRLLDFVSDAFTSVKQAMNAAKENGTIPGNEPIFSNFSIKRAYRSPIELYNAYVDELMSRFRNDYLSDKGIKKEVIKLNQFVNHFIKFLKQEPSHSPFTFTSWQRSSTSNILTSGIAVDIGGIEFGADPRIEDLVLNSTSLPYYLKVCRANGFLVSQLAPTVMVADILSPGLLPYAKANGIFSTEDVFLSRYNYAYTIDYDLMQAKLIDGYNLFVANFPIEKINTSKCPKTISSIIKFREPITIAQAQQSISINQWLSAYTQIRNIEERGALSEQMFNKLIKRIKTTKYVDNFQAMRYINNTFRDTYKSKYGGLNYFIHREEERNKDTEPSTESTSGASKINNGGSSGGY
jgi:hypothetical protein